jgi:hypothetical protein
VTAWTSTSYIISSLSTNLRCASRCFNCYRRHQTDRPTDRPARYPSVRQPVLGLPGWFERRMSADMMILGDSRSPSLSLSLSLSVDRRRRLASCPRNATDLVSQNSPEGFCLPMSPSQTRVSWQNGSQPTDSNSGLVSSVGRSVRSNCVRLV